MQRSVRPVRLVVAIVLASVVGAACSSGSASSPSTAASAGPSTAPVELTVYAASSLTGAFTALATGYANAYPGSTITLAFGASSTMRTQIEQGAPADVFVSADMTNPQKLADEGQAIGSPKVFAANELTIIVPNSGSSPVKTPADLAKAGVKVVAAGDSVPVSTYAKQLLAKLAKQPGYPAGFAAKVTANIVSQEDNVKAVVAKIELGEGDAAIVYVTDAKASTKVNTIDVPAEANIPATYAAVVVKGTKHAPQAQAFLEWLTGADARSIMSTYGFLPPPQ